MSNSRQCYDEDDCYDEREIWEVERDFLAAKAEASAVSESYFSQRVQIESQRSLESDLWCILEGGRSGSLPVWTPSENINQDLRKFYFDHIKDDSLEYVKRIFEKDLEEIKYEFRTRNDEPYLKRTVCQGSSYDETNIKGSGVEFDVLLVLEDHKILQAKRIENFPGFVTIKPSCLLRDASDQSSNVQYIYNSLDVSPVVIVNSVLGKLQKIINASPKLNGYAKFRAHGPALQLDRYKCNRNVCNCDELCTYRNGEFSAHGKLYSADLVPAFELKAPVSCVSSEDLIYVAKGPKRIGRADILTRAWRQSYGNEEKNFIDKLTYEHRVVLRICKHILSIRVELQKLSSYHLKNAFLFAVKENEEDWEHPHTTKKVVEVWKIVLRQLKEKKMPSYFNDKVNLIEFLSEQTGKDMYGSILGFSSSEKQFRELLEHLFRAAKASVKV